MYKMSFDFAIKQLLSISFTSLLAFGGEKKKSLAPSGRNAAIVVGYFTCMAGFEFAATLFWFFVSCSMLTKFGSEKKKRIDAEFREGGQRDALQVFANGAGGTLMAIGCVLFSNIWPNDSLFRFCLFGFIGHYACCQGWLRFGFFIYLKCCLGDTFASEFGGAFPTSDVRLITKPWVRVPAGTNGGVTFLGTAAAIVGGLTLGLVYSLTSSFVHGGRILEFASMFDAVVLFVIAAFVGTTVDSILGALLQLSAWDAKEKKVLSHNTATSTHITGIDLLTNSGVNFFSALLTMIVIGFCGVFISK